MNFWIGKGPVQLIQVLLVLFNHVFFFIQLLTPELNLSPERFVKLFQIFLQRGFDSEFHRKIYEILLQ